MSGKRGPSGPARSAKSGEAASIAGPIGAASQVDLALRELSEELVVRTGSAEQPFGTYVVHADDPAAELGRHVEREVFQEYFGNTRELLEREYDPYEPASMFLCVVDHRRLVPAGVMRMILPGSAGQKSLADMARVWSVDVSTAFSGTGVEVDRSRVWDIATLAVARDYRGGGSEGLVSIALYQAAFQTALPGNAGWFVAILDSIVVDLIETRLHRPFSHFAGVEPRTYLDSPASLPVFVDIEDYRRRLAASDATMHALLFGGTGLEAAVRPPDWADAVRRVVSRVSPSTA